MEREKTQTGALFSSCHVVFVLYGFAFVGWVSGNPTRLSTSWHS